MPPGELVIVPEPRPAFRTARLNDWSANDAVTFLTASMVTVQAPVPEQAPDQPAKVEVASGAAASVTVLPESNCAEQVATQLIPPGLEVTPPVPLPAFATVSSFAL